MEEKCLVVSRDKLFGGNDEYAFEGFLKDWRTDVLDIIHTHGEFCERKEMETDPLYKQIIPLGAYRFQDSIYVYQRKGGDNRLIGNYDIGIGGHIHPDDQSSHAKKTLENCLLREFHEEIFFDAPFTFTLLGYVNSDKEMVGKVHFGMLYLLGGTSADISSKEADIPGKLMTLKEASELNLNGWQKYIFDALLK